jgi:OPA family glycerol-3-phosphate transporter-like MFS transporter
VRATCSFNSRPRRLLCSVSSNLRRIRARLPEAEIDPLYRRLRWQIFLGIFFGYAAYYLVRKNFALAMPYLVEQGFSRGDLGFALSGISIAYGFSKFIMGSVSDRSNPRVFLPAGLILAAR